MHCICMEAYVKYLFLYGPPPPPLTAKDLIFISKTASLSCFSKLVAWRLQTEFSTKVITEKCRYIITKMLANINEF